MRFDVTLLALRSPATVVACTAACSRRRVNSRAHGMARDEGARRMGLDNTTSLDGHDEEGGDD